VSQPHASLQQLLDKVLADPTASEERQELTELLERDKDLAAEFLEQMQTHSLLVLQGRREQGFVRLAGLLQKTPSHVFNVNKTSDRDTFARRSWLIAACLLIAGFAVVWKVWLSASSDSPILAEILQQRDVTWSKNSTALDPNGLVTDGRLELSAGDITLQFRSGVVLHASGPVSMNIQSDMLVFLELGQANAHVPKWAKGFTIATPDVEVIDLGTKFGVLAREDESTDVLVFEGEVDFKPSFAKDAEQKRLYQGEGVRVSSLGTVDRVVEVRREPGNTWWTTERSSGVESIFKSIRDNILLSDSSKYYEIVPHGFGEDVRAYVDRPHEWNSFSPQGVPEFLKAADYIRTFNDLKYRSNLEITVELARPATVYVFYDNRVPPPEWLTSQFEDTNVDIGLDEGPWEFADPSMRVAVGAGTSLDQTFSVWQRVCSTPEKLKLGSMGQHPGARAIYGIAASALD
jgi:hypothetical protein